LRHDTPLTSRRIPSSPPLRRCIVSYKSKAISLPSMVRARGRWIGTFAPPIAIYPRCCPCRYARRSRSRLRTGPQWRSTSSVSSALATSTPISRASPCSPSPTIRCNSIRLSCSSNRSSFPSFCFLSLVLCSCPIGGLLSRFSQPDRRSGRRDRHLLSTAFGTSPSDWRLAIRPTPESRIAIRLNRSNDPLHLRLIAILHRRLHHQRLAIESDRRDGDHVVAEVVRDQRSALVERSV